MYVIQELKRGWKLEFEMIFMGFRLRVLLIRICDF